MLGSEDVLVPPPRRSSLPSAPTPPEALMEDASPSLLGSFLFDVGQVSYPVLFLHDILWLAGVSHGETVTELNCTAGAKGMASGSRLTRASMFHLLIMGQGCPSDRLLRSSELLLPVQQSLGQERPRSLMSL